MTSSRQRRDILSVVLIVVGTFALLLAFMPYRHPIHRTLHCANGATPITWKSADGDGQTFTNMRCTP